MRRRRSAFTLVELLVIVAIVSILIAILVPTVRNTKCLARGSLCAAKMHRYSMAYENYSQDHNGVCLSAYNCWAWVTWQTYTGWNNSELWLIYTWMEPYLSQGKQDYWVDPANSGTDPNTAGWNAIGWWDYGYPSGGIAAFDRGWMTATYRAGATYPVRMVEMPNPSLTGLFFCSTCRPPGLDRYDHNHGVFIINLNGDYDPWNFHGASTSLYSANLRGGGSQTNVVRLDGSVRTYPWRDLVSPGCHPFAFSDYELKTYQYTIARQYLYTGKVNDGWLRE